MARCRVCQQETLVEFLSLGPTPLANRFLIREQLEETEPSFPLDVHFCHTCGLVQLVDVVPAEVLFHDYPYFTGVSSTMRAHFAELAEDVAQEYHVGPGSLVVDIGSNDGTLLFGFQRFGPKILGIEPAANVAATANAAGIHTINQFFDPVLSEEIVRTRGSAHVVLATNVFAHIHHLDHFLQGVSAMLSPKGVLVIEVPYLVDILNNTEFDTIYHEHLSYFAVRPIVVILARFGMRIVGLKRIRVHGGSIRVAVQKSPAHQSPVVDQFLTLEAERRLDSIHTYHDFAQRVRMIKNELVTLLRDLNARGKRIVGYGAPAKGNVLLNFCKIGPDLLDYLVDTTPFKQGRYSPGMHIPIYPEQRFHEEPPDYALMLAWNYADEILAKETAYRQRGGKFIIPISRPTLV
jgi:D-mycarose 3-C-methyltransferase